MALCVNVFVWIFVINVLYADPNNTCNYTAMPFVATDFNPGLPDFLKDGDSDYYVYSATSAEPTMSSSAPSAAPSFSPTTTPSHAPTAPPTSAPTPLCPTLLVEIEEESVSFDESDFEGMYTFVYDQTRCNRPIWNVPQLAADKSIEYDGIKWIIYGEGNETLSSYAHGKYPPIHDVNASWIHSSEIGEYHVSIACIESFAPNAAPSNAPTQPPTNAPSVSPVLSPTAAPSSFVLVSHERL